MAPRRRRLRRAFATRIGSKVQVTRRRPRRSASSRCAHFRRSPTPRPREAGTHREHVGVEVGRAAAEGGERVAEAHDAVARGLGDQEQPAGVDGRQELDGRGDLEVGEAPDLPLELHAGVVVAPLPRGPDEDVHGGGV